MPMLMGGNSLGQSVGYISLDVTGVDQGVNQAMGSIGQLDSMGSAGLSGLEKSLNGVGLSSQKVGIGFTAMGAALLTPVAAGLQGAIKLEQAFTDIKASMDPKDYGQMKEIEKMVIDIGASGQYSAGEIAAVTQELVKSGFAIDSILSGDPADGFGNMAQAVSDLSSATGSGLEPAVRGISSAMNIWHPSIVDADIALTDASRAADIFTVAANASAADTTDIIAGMRNFGPVAAGMGIGFEDAAAAIAMFTNYGLKATVAGTALSTGMQRLAAPTGKAKDVMDQLGISAWDSQGAFIGMPQLFNQLRDKMGGMTDQAKMAALTTIFGAEAMDVMGLAVLDGADSLETIMGQMGQYGIAGEQAAMRTRTLQGAIERLTEGIMTALAVAMSGLVGPLTMLANGLDWLVSIFASLPQPVITAIGMLTALAGVSAVATGGFLLLAPRVREVMIGVRAMATMVGPMGALARVFLTVTGFAGPFARLGSAILSVVTASKMLTLALGGIFALGIFAYNTNALGFGDWIQSQVDRATSAWKSFQSLFGASINETLDQRKFDIGAAFDGAGIVSEAGAGADGKDWFVLGADGERIGQILESYQDSDGSIQMKVEFPDGTTQWLTQDAGGTTTWGDGAESAAEKAAAALSPLERFNKGIDSIQESLRRNGFGPIATGLEWFQDGVNGAIGVANKARSVVGWLGDFNTAFQRAGATPGISFGEKLRSAWFATRPFDGFWRDLGDQLFADAEASVGSRIGGAADLIFTQLGFPNLAERIAGATAPFRASLGKVAGTVSDFAGGFGQAWDAMWMATDLSLFEKFGYSLANAFGEAGFAGAAMKIASVTAGTMKFVDTFRKAWGSVDKLAFSGHGLGDRGPMSGWDKGVYSLATALRAVGFDGAADLVEKWGAKLGTYINKLPSFRQVIDSLRGTLSNAGRGFMDFGQSVANGIGYVWSNKNKLMEVGKNAWDIFGSIKDSAGKTDIAGGRFSETEQHVSKLSLALISLSTAFEQMGMHGPAQFFRDLSMETIAWETALRNSFSAFKNLIMGGDILGALGSIKQGIKDILFPKTKGFNESETGTGAVYDTTTITGKINWFIDQKGWRDEVDSLARKLEWLFNNIGYAASAAVSAITGALASLGEFAWNLLIGKPAMIGDFDVNAFLTEWIGKAVEWSIDITLDAVIDFFEDPGEQAKKLLIASIAASIGVLAVTGGLTAAMVLLGVVGLAVLLVAVVKKVVDYFRNNPEARADISMKIGIIWSKLEDIPILGLLFRAARFLYENVWSPLIRTGIAIRNWAHETGGAFGYVAERIESMWLAMVGLDLLEKLGRSAFLGKYTKDVGDAKVAVQGLEAALYGIMKLLKLPFEFSFRPLNLLKQITGGTDARTAVKAMDQLFVNATMGEFVEAMGKAGRSLRPMAGLAGNTTEEFRLLRVFGNLFADSMRIAGAILSSMLSPAKKFKRIWDGIFGAGRGVTAELDNIYSVAKKAEKLTLYGDKIPMKELQRFADIFDEVTKSGRMWKLDEVFNLGKIDPKLKHFASIHGDLQDEYKKIFSFIEKTDGRIGRFNTGGKITAWLTSIERATSNNLMRRGGLANVIRQFFLAPIEIPAKWLNKMFKFDRALKGGLNFGSPKLFLKPFTSWIDDALNIGVIDVAARERAITNRLNGIRSFISKETSKSLKGVISAKGLKFPSGATTLYDELYRIFDPKGLDAEIGDGIKAVRGTVYSDLSRIETDIQKAIPKTSKAYQRFEDVVSGHLDDLNDDMFRRKGTFGKRIVGGILRSLEVAFKDITSAFRTVIGRSAGAFNAATRQWVDEALSIGHWDLPKKVAVTERALNGAWDDIMRSINTPVASGWMRTRKAWQTQLDDAFRALDPRASIADVQKTLSAAVDALPGLTKADKTLIGGIVEGYIGTIDDADFFKGGTKLQKAFASIFGGKVPLVDPKTMALGDAFGGVFDNLLGMAGRFGSRFGSVFGKIGKAIGGQMSAIAKNFDTASGIFAKFFPWFNRFGTAGPKVGLALAAASLASFLWAKNLFGLKDAFGGTVEAIGAGISALVAAWGENGLAGVIDKIESSIHGALDDIPGTLSNIANSPAWAMLFSMFGIFAGMFIGGPLGLAIGLFAPLVAKMATGVINSVGRIMDAWDRFGKAGAIKQIGAEISKALGGASKMFTSFGLNLMKVGDALGSIPIIGGPLSSFFNTIGGAIQGFGFKLGDLQGHFDQARAMGMTPFQAAIYALNQEFPGFMSGLKKVVNVVRDLREVFAKIADGDITGAFSSLGDAVTGALEVIVDLRDEVLDQLGIHGKWRTAIEAVTVALGILGVALLVHRAVTAFTTAINAARAAMLLFNASLLTNPIVLIVVALAALAAAVYFAYQEFEWFRNAVNGTWAVIKAGASLIWDGLVAAFNAVASVAQTVWGWLTKIFGGAFSAGISSIISSLQKMVAPFVSLGKAIADLFQGDWSGAWDNLVDAAKKVLPAVIAAVTAIPAAIFAFIRNVNWGELWSDISNSFWAVVNAFRNIDWTGLLSGAWDAIEASLELAWETISSIDWSEVIGEAVEVGTKVYEWILEQLGSIATSDIVGSIYRVGAGVYNYIKSFFADFSWSSLLGDMVDIGESVLDFIIGLFPDSIDFEMPSPTEIAEAIARWATGGGSDGKDNREARQRDPAERTRQYGESAAGEAYDQINRWRLNRDIAAEMVETMDIASRLLGQSASEGVLNAVRDAMGKDKPILPGGFMGTAPALPSTKGQDINMPAIGTTAFSASSAAVQGILAALHTNAIAKTMATSLGITTEYNRLATVVPPSTTIMAEAIKAKYAELATVLPTQTGMMGNLIGLAYNQITARALSQSMATNTAWSTNTAAMKTSGSANANALQVAANTAFTTLLANAQAKSSAMNSYTVAQTASMRSAGTGQFNLFQSQGSAAVQALANSTRTQTSSMASTAGANARSMAGTGISEASRMSSGMGASIAGIVGNIAGQAARWVTTIVMYGGSMYSAGRGVGYQLGAGVAAGMDAAHGMVAAAAARIIATARIAASAAAMINSPARIMKPVGMGLTEGVAHYMVTPNALRMVASSAREMIGYAESQTALRQSAASFRGGYGSTSSGGTQVIVTNNTNLASLDRDEMLRILDNMERSRQTTSHLSSARGYTQYERR